MSFKPDEKDWMAYLYGEQEDEDKQQMEQYILQHPEGREELEKFERLRAMFATVADKEVLAPPIFIAENPAGNTRGIQRFFWEAPYFKLITSIAASLLLIILAGKLTDTQLTLSDNEIRLSFGNSPPKNAVQQIQSSEVLSPDEVQAMINASLNNHNSLMLAGLQATQEKLDASIRKNLSSSSGKIDQHLREASLASQLQIKQFVDGIRTENMQQVKDYFQLTSTEQKQYIENLLVDFAQYLQQERNNDLQLVQTRMNSLEQNTDIFKQETEQILSSIITTVGNTNPDETKN